jgi:hypothetical protein
VKQKFFLCLINEKKKKIVEISCHENYEMQAIIVANTEIEMKEMMKNLRKYMTKKKLEVNVEKTKMMVFNKRKKKSDENERNEFIYLGYTFNERATDKGHIRGIVRKANT